MKYNIQLSTLTNSTAHVSKTVVILTDIVYRLE